MTAESKDASSRDKVAKAYIQGLARPECELLTNGVCSLGESTPVHEESTQRVDQRQVLMPGSRLAGFRIDALVGHGGMARVYAGRDAAGSRIAIKVPVASGLWQNEHLKREFRIGRSVRAETVVKMRSLHQHGDLVFLTQDFVSGMVSNRWVRRDAPFGELPSLERVYQFVGAVARSLCDLHASHVVHCDLKPNNILFDRNGFGTIIDLGLANWVKTLGSWRNANSLPGTFRYLAPEVVLNNWLDFSSDIYSFGRCLAYMLSGRLPSFDLPSQQTWDDSIVAERIAAQLPRHTPKDLVDLCVQMHCFDPNGRPTAQSVSDRFCETPTEPTNRSSTPSTPKNDHRVRDILRDSIQATLGSHGRFVPVLMAMPEHHRSIRRAVESMRGEFSSLVLHAEVSVDEHIPMRAIDPIFSSLGHWMQNLNPSLLTRWRLRPGSEVAQASPLLASILTPRPAISMAQAVRVDGLNDLGSLFRSLAQERIVLLCLEHLEYADEQSWHALSQLVEATRHCRLVILAGVDLHDPEALRRTRQLVQSVSR